ncbi:N-acetyltransferase eso1 [Coemansia javaensis]|uniref:N-acetyltransferase eso1 n=1 Tax=Coemansia javaensis TaxID=2761396 RepID=A0A9W8HP04_9FUNG|nr:N-acetyltransferase eso1 [Coemansia javaensis]
MMADTSACRAAVAAELARHRAILHIDLDCFYCQVEQLRLGVSPDVPLAVQQWQGLVAVNYPARRRGVRRHDSVKEAREKCPELMLVHVPTLAGSGPAAYHPNPSPATHKASLDEYRRASRRIMDLFRRLCPTMAKASIDEACLDVSEPIRAMVLADMDRGALELLDAQDAALAGGAEPAAVPVPVVRWVAASRKGKEPEAAGAAAATASDYGMLVGDAPPVSAGWGDLVLRYAAEFARHVRGTLLREQGYRASAGIAHNRLLAKIGSGLHKPDQQTVMLHAHVAAFMRTLPIAAIPSLGGKLGALVEAAFGARTVADLAAYTLDQLALRLGADQAQHVYNRCHGIDDSAVVDNREPGSFSSSKTFYQRPAADMARLERWIVMNSIDLWTRVSEEWDERRRWPRLLGVSFSTIGQHHRAKTVPFPLRHQRGAQSSPDAVVDAVRACLAAEGPGLFPVGGLSLSARSFQRELASASLMERWLTKPRESLVTGAPRAASPLPGGDDDEAAGLVDSSGESTAATAAAAAAADYDDDTGIPDLQQHKLSTMLRLQTQPTTRVPPSQRPPPMLPQPPAGLPLPQPPAGLPPPQPPPNLPLQQQHQALSASAVPLPENYDICTLPATPGSMTQPGLMGASEAETSDSDQSCLRTPAENGTDQGESGEESGEVSTGDDDDDDNNNNNEGDGNSNNGRGNNGRGHNGGGGGGVQGRGDDAATSQRAASRAASRAAALRRQPGVYIQPHADQASAARLGEGYKSMSVDPYDDANLELSVVGGGGGQRIGNDGFIPALIAATRRKREIQIVRFQNTVDAPEDAIENTRHALGDEDKAARQRRKAGSSRAARAQPGDEDNGDDDDDDGGDDDASGSSDDERDAVLDLSVAAWMESIAASQTVMEIRCPRCPDDAPPVPSNEWGTHHDWHLARQLQERELRHDSVARQLLSAFSGRVAPKRPRPRSRSTSPKRRQQTITEAWR